jgi:hypothetical protein
MMAVVRGIAITPDLHSLKMRRERETKKRIDTGAFSYSYCLVQAWEPSRRPDLLHHMPRSLQIMTETRVLLVLDPDGSFKGELC